MKSKEYVNMMLRRARANRNKAKKEGNDKKFYECCAVIRNLKIVLEVEE
jgi:hypothetical protein